MEDEMMTGKEIVNLIFELKAKGLSSDEIIDMIITIETRDPKDAIAKYREK